MIRRSIRGQILVPLVAIQVGAIAAIAATTATLAARRAERQTIDRLNGVVDTLGRSSFPFTEGVLAKMKGLSGAEFVAFGPGGGVEATSFEERAAPPTLQTVPPTARIEAIGDSPAVIVGGVPYLAASLRSTTGPRGSSLLVLYPETTWRQARREAAAPPLLLGLASIALMATVTSLIAHRISRRIGLLQREVARIAAGDFRGLEPAKGADEVADLAGSINAMCGRLREMSRTIQQSERTRLLAQLAAGLAHQLRNSLTGARMSIGLHARRHPTPEGDGALQVALRQLALTEEHVKGLLSLGRVEPRPHAPCDLDALAREVASLVQPSSEHARVTLSVGQGAGAPPLMGDESGLRAALLNLALNAIEAAGPGGSVRVEALAEGDIVALQVTDSGSGPPPDLAESLFDPFTTGKPEGVGLGLALAHEVAERHGGTLSWSRVDGTTRFRLTFPRPRPDR